MNRVLKQGENKICFIVSSPGTARAFLKYHILELSKEYRVYLVANFSDASDFNLEGVSHYENIGIVRRISIFKDIYTVIRLAVFFIREHFIVTHSVSPKAGFVAAIASWLAGVPHRIHIFTGQVWANKKGIKRRILKLADKLIFRLDNHFLTDSEGQRDFLIQEQMVGPQRIKVLGPGSICGVDIKKFSPSKRIRIDSRNALGIREHEIVYVFLGRLTRDKGINELLSAFQQIDSLFDDSRLLLIGEDEGNYSLNLRGKHGILYTGHTNRPQDLLQAGDIFCLPSFREGFGNSVIEASAMGLPVICSDIYGLKDAMIDDVTGLRCTPGDVHSLLSCMMKLHEDLSLRIRLGENGRLRVMERFPSNIVTNSWVEYYKNL